MIAEAMDRIIHPHLLHASVVHCSMEYKSGLLWKSWISIDVLITEVVRRTVAMSVPRREILSGRDLVVHVVS
jgi:hypothetical protein